MGYVIFTTLVFFYSLLFYCASKAGTAKDNGAGTKAEAFVRNRF